MTWESNNYRYQDNITYHSTEWALLVETGWITVSVDDHGFATMCRPLHRKMRQ